MKPGAVELNAARESKHKPFTPDRNTMRAIFCTLICLLSLFGPGAAVAAGDFPSAGTGNQFDSSGALAGDEEFLPVEKAYMLNAEFERRDDKPLLRLNWQIAQGYYLYRKGFHFELSSAGKAIAVTPAIPDGTEKQDEYFGKVQVYHNAVDIELPDIPAHNNLQLAVTSQGCAEAGLCYPPHTEYFQLDGQQLTALKSGQPGQSSSGGSTQGEMSSPQPTPSGGPTHILYMMLLAMLGGTILNLMPCVFPVLSLKVLGFANDKGHSPVVHGFTYSAGVVASFVAVAAVLVTLKAAGQAIGWGFHLQSPWFVAALCYLFFAMGLSLSGFVEFGSQWMNLGGKLTARSGYESSFFTGVLATVVASPCTAPFMGTALGFAVTQPTAIALLVFAALGVGMALPVLILSCSPALLKHIPKPGPWMDTLKQVLAYPLFLTAIWLSWVVGNQTGVNGMAALLIGCLLIVFAIWLWRGKTLQRSVGAACAAIALAMLGTPLFSPSANAPAAEGENWQAYSPELLKQLRSEGKPVFVNITADWCITCLTNEKVTLSSDAVQQSMLRSGVTYLKGDWTNYDPRITALLSQYGRTGIPLYLVFPAGHAEHAQVLPQILTVSTVVNALDSAAEPVALASHP